MGKGRKKLPGHSYLFSSWSSSHQELCEPCYMDLVKMRAQLGLASHSLYGRLVENTVLGCEAILSGLQNCPSDHGWGVRAEALQSSLLLCWPCPRCLWGRTVGMTQQSGGSESPLCLGIMEQVCWLTVVQLSSPLISLMLQIQFLIPHSHHREGCRLHSSPSSFVPRHPLW